MSDEDEPTPEPMVMIQRWKEAVRRPLAATTPGRAGAAATAQPARVVTTVASTGTQRSTVGSVARPPRKPRKLAANVLAPMRTRAAATRVARPKRARARVDYAALEASGFPVLNDEIQSEPAPPPSTEQPPRRIRARAVPADEGPFRSFTSRVKGQIRRARYYQTIIDTHEAETWTQQRDARAGPVVQTSALMTEALAGVLDVKKKLRAVLLELAHAHDSLLQVSHTEDDDGIPADAIICSVCRNIDNDLLPNNDTLMCDREGCNLAFHQQCCAPQVLDTSSLEEDWFCPRCTCLDNALCVVNEVFESEFTEAAGVFAELDAKDGPLAAEPAGDEAPDASSYHSSEDSDFSASASDLSSGSVSSDSSDSDSDSDSVASFGGHSGHSTGSVSAADGTHLLSGASISNDSSSDGEARKVRTRGKRPAVDYATLNTILFGDAGAADDPDASDEAWSPGATPQKRAK